MSVSEKLRSELKIIAGSEIATLITNCFDEIARHFATRNWKTAGLDAGHFVEAIRRLLELKLFGTATAVGKSLPNFNEAALKSYESASGDDAYRILIPRLLYALYALRNKRSIGHLGAVPASELDASILLQGAQWTLAEVLRIESQKSPEELRRLVSYVTQRHIPIAWTEGDTTRILDKSITARNQVLLLLLINGHCSEAQLRSDVGYANPTNFRKILKRLHVDRLIEYTIAESNISPTGRMVAEKILVDKGLI